MKPEINSLPNVSLSIWAKLSTRLTLLILLLSTVPLIIVGYLAFDNGRRTIKQNTIDRLNSITILKEAEFDLWVQGHERSLQALAQRPLVREYAAVLSTYDMADPQYQSLRTSLHQDHLDPALVEGDWLELFLLRVDDGLIFFSTDERQEGKYRENDPYFMEGQDRTYVKNVYYSLTLEEAAMAISTPVKDSEGNLIAVLVGRLDLTTMSQIMAQGRELTSSEETYLINKFKFFATESRFSSGYILNKAIHTEGIDKCLLHNEGVGLYDDYRGIPVIGVYRWLPQRELCILTEIDQSEAFAPIVAFGNAILGIGVAVALIVVFLALSFARTITVPVSQLTQGAEEIGQGNLAYRIKVKARNEFGQLAAAFNDMASTRERAADALQKAHDELERKVEQRTADLTLTNENLQVEIAERKQAEEALRESKERFESITVQSPIPMVITKPNGDIEYFNDKFTKLFGYTLEDVSTAEEWWRIVYPDEGYRRLVQKSWEKAIARAAETRTQIETQEWDLTCKDRSIRRVEFDMTPLGEMSVITLNDITDRVQAEEALRKAKSELEIRVVARTRELTEANARLKREIKERQQSEEKFRTLLESAPVAVVIVDGNGRIELINSQTEKMFDRSRHDLLGQPIEVLLPEQLRDIHVNHRQGYLDEPHTRLMGPDLELFGRRKDGSQFPIDVGLSTITMGETVLIMSFISDITERKQTEELIKASLREKEVLLREIHHRVKNNLQTISSLLSLQAKDTRNEQTLEILRESQNRVKSMALVHEKLHHSQNLARIDGVEYIYSLITYLVRSYGINPADVGPKLDEGEIFLEIDDAITCGLIVNELVSNALKYAFPTRTESDRVSVKFQSESGNQLTLIVADNGIGFPEDLDFRHTESLGLQLVNDLTKQLKGHIELYNHEGAKFKITFAI